MLVNNEKQKREKKFRWIKEHKFEISAGFCFLSVAVVGTIIGLKCKNHIKINVEELPTIPIDEVKQMTNDVIGEISRKIKSSPKSTHIRSAHTRNLGNRTASTHKLIEAAERNIKLVHQTLVRETVVNAI